MPATRTADVEKTVGGGGAGVVVTGVVSDPGELWPVAGVDCAQPIEAASDTNRASVGFETPIIDPCRRNLISTRDGVSGYRRGKKIANES